MANNVNDYLRLAEDAVWNANLCNDKLDKKTHASNAQAYATMALAAAIRDA